MNVVYLLAHQPAGFEGVYVEAKKLGGLAVDADINPAHEGVAEGFRAGEIGDRLPGLRVQISRRVV